MRAFESFVRWRHQVNVAPLSAAEKAILLQATKAHRSREQLNRLSFSLASALVLGISALIAESQDRLASAPSTEVCYLGMVAGLIGLFDMLTKGFAERYLLEDLEAEVAEYQRFRLLEPATAGDD